MGNKNKTIIVSGHRLGAAIATLVGIDLLQSGYTNIVVYSFASPRIGDNVFKTFFEMRFAQCTFTKGEYVKNKNMTDEPQLIITDNKRFVKNSNQYCIFITNDKIQLNFLNNNLESKKFIGNFFYSEQRYNPASIYLTNKFLNELKVNLTRIGINNCNINLAILLSLVLYIPDKHSFSSNEIYNNWRLSSNEKKLILFMVKKKLINMY